MKKIFLRKIYKNFFRGSFFGELKALFWEVGQSKAYAELELALERKKIYYSLARDGIYLFACISLSTYPNAGDHRVTSRISISEYYAYCTDNRYYASSAVGRAPSFYNIGATARDSHNHIVAFYLIRHFSQIMETPTLAFLAALLLVPFASGQGEGIVMLDNSATF